MLYVELRAFHAVAAAGGFTRAAERLNLTQPTLSSQVAALEARHGVALFYRRRRRVEPTPLGERLLEIARRLFDVEREAVELLAAEPSLASGRLALGADSPHHVVKALAQFAARYPGVRVSLAIGNSTDLLAQLADYRFDLAILADPPAERGLVVQTIRRDRLVLAAHRDHALARRKRIALRRLNGAKLVLRERGSTTRAIFERALAASGAAPGPVMEIDSREAVREAVAAGLGLGVVSEAEFGADSRLAKIRLDGAGLEMTEYAVRLAERRPSRAVEAFFALLPRLSADAKPGSGG